MNQIKPVNLSLADREFLKRKPDQSMIDLGLVQKGKDQNVFFSTESRCLQTYDGKNGYAAAPHRGSLTAQGINVSSTHALLQSKSSKLFQQPVN